MYLNWDKKITDLCDKLGFVPELYNEDEEFMEWIANHFGFKNYATFQALACPKDILSGMALDMLPDHKNYELYLAEDCITMIGINYDLYDDDKRTCFEINNFLQFIQENFSDEMIVVAMKKLTENAECVIKFLSTMDIYNTLTKRYNQLEIKI